MEAQRLDRPLRLACKAGRQSGSTNPTLLLHLPALPLICLSSKLFNAQGIPTHSQPYQPTPTCPLVFMYSRPWKSFQSLAHTPALAPCADTSAKCGTLRAGGQAKSMRQGGHTQQAGPPGQAAVQAH